MGETTNISWADATWNPVTGCTKVSPGCRHCYAETLAERYRGSPAYPFGFEVTLRPHKLREPTRWKTPKKVFVCSMSDLFHRAIPPDYLQEVWRTMCETPRHVYQVLTKRPHRAAHLIRELGLPLPPHIWVGTSVESQTWAVNRIPALLSIPAAVRWLSCEPLLGPVDLGPWLPQLQWVVTGGESGSGRTVGEYSWFRTIRDACGLAGVPMYHKQGYANWPGQDRLLDGRTWEEFPALDHPALRRAA